MNDSLERNVSRRHLATIASLLAVPLLSLAGCATDPDATPTEVVATAAAPTTNARDTRAGRKLVPWQAIVRLRSGATLDAAELALRAISPAISDASVAPRGSAEPPPLHVVHFNAAAKLARGGADPIAETWALIDELAARPEVEYAHPNWTFQLSRVPNDPLWPAQGNLRHIAAPQAWDVTTGSPAIRIAILDTGANQHPDLSNKWVPGLEYDAVAEDGDAQSASWRHGLHVASIAAGASDNPRGTAGVCWGCQLLNVNVADENSTPALDKVARGIVWAVDNGANVINMSFESDPDYPLNCSDPSWAAMRDAVAYAIGRNVTLVAAAGNFNNDATYTVPASCPGVISVAATPLLDPRAEEPLDPLASYSNWGGVTLAAPGGGPRDDGELRGDTIVGPNTPACLPHAASAFHPFARGVVAAWSTANEGPTSNAHCYRYLSGTSMAAPHVAGVVGLMLSRNPTLTPAQVKTILTSTAFPLGCPRPCGAGFLDASRAVRAAAPWPTSDATPAARFTWSCAALTCTFNATSSTDDLGIASYQWALPGGQVRTGATATFYMPGYAQHSVKLTVTDTTGHTAVVTHPVSPSQPSLTPAAGMYWNPQRSGNGLDFLAHHNGGWRAYWYTYEPGGAPIWYRSDVATRSGARWSAPLYRDSATSSTLVGSIALDFSSSTRAWLSWTLDGKPGGEPYELLFGAEGRSGVWKMTAESGWSFQLKESGGTLLSTLGIFHQGKPRWLQGAAPASANVTIPLSYISGPGLCPSCGGRAPAAVNSSWEGSSMTVQIADGNATTGSASTSARFIDSNGAFNPVWIRALQSIQLLTPP